ncbi:MAG: PKD domain-containing protein [Thermoplasmata archaeon]|nr:PKD domain-containing protein [Thermoplasmata archaeon]
MEGRRVLLYSIVLTSLLAVAGPSLADPGVDAGGPYGGPDTYEGSSIGFYATTDNQTNWLWRWDFQNDGIWDTTWDISATMSYAIERYYCDDYHGHIAVEAWDGFSTKTVIINGEPVLVPDSEKDTARVDVFNALPILDPGGPYLGSPGVPITFRAVGRDPGCDDLTFIWLWGDGDSDLKTYEWTHFQVEVVDEREHTYAEEGTYTVTLFLLDDDGGYVEASFNILIRSGVDDIDDMIDYTEGLPIPGGIRKGLVAQLNAARGCLVRFHEQPAVRILGAFVHRVEVLERRGTLTEEQSDFMTASAHDIVWKIG